MRIRMLALLCLCSAGLARATPKTSNLPFTEKQFEMAVACIKHFEGWHNMKDYVGYGHQLQKGERYSAKTMTKTQGDLLLRLDLMRNLYLFRNYGKDALLLSVLAYNVGPYAILGTSKRPKSRLLRKIERGDRNIYNDYIAFCRWHGRQVKSIKFLLRQASQGPSAVGKWNTTCSLCAERTCPGWSPLAASFGAFLCGVDYGFGVLL